MERSASDEADRSERGRQGVNRLRTSVFIRSIITESKLRLDQPHMLLLLILILVIIAGLL